MAAIERFANPNRFLGLARPCLPWLGGATVLTLGIGLYLALFDSPPDYQQGETVRIMYVHVPAAWMALFCYVAMAAAAGVALVFKHPLADLAARATAPVGAAFTLLALATGSLWGQPMWGTWWVWDARLTSVLVLFFLYLGYIALANAFDDPARGNKAAGILALVGVVNVPIIKFSVDWWNTLHQPAAVARMDGPTIHADMLWPLLIMALAYKLFYLYVLIVRIEGEVAQGKLRSLQRRRARSAEATGQPAGEQA